MTTVIAAIITAVFALVGTIIGTSITAKASSNKMRTQIEIALAVLNSEFEELTREVREHNNFAKRMPVVEEQVNTLKEQIKSLQNKAEK